MQLAATLIYFYVFGLGAVILTYVIVKFIRDYVASGKREQPHREPSKKDTP